MANNLNTQIDALVTGIAALTPGILDPVDYNYYNVPSIDPESLVTEDGSRDSTRWYSINQSAIIPAGIDSPGRAHYQGQFVLSVVYTFGRMNNDILNDYLSHDQTQLVNYLRDPTTLTANVDAIMAGSIMAVRLGSDYVINQINFTIHYWEET